MSLTKRQKASPSRGWARAKPTHVGDRRKLNERCGQVCFGDPKNLKYPVCAKPKAGRVSCKPDCRGLESGYARARQQHHPKIAARLRTKATRQGCGWAKG